MKSRFHFPVIVILLSMLVTSCYFNPSMMLKTDKNYKFSSIPDSSTEEYIISPNDVLTFRLFYNDGFKLIDLSTGVTSRNNIQVSGFSYLIEYDGKVKFPLIRRVDIDGLTIRQAELMLEEMYAAYYVKPFVMLKVTNRRVTVFPGSSGDAQIVNLVNENTTLIEALALAGGIASTGKAKKVKVIRKKPAKKKGYDVYLMNLSKIEGLEQAQLVLQANDIVYVDPIPNLAQQTLKNISPFVSLLTSFVLVWTIFKPAN